MAKGGSGFEGRYRIAFAIVLLCSLTSAATGACQSPPPRPPHQRLTGLGGSSRRSQTHLNLKSQYQWEERWFEQTLDHFSAKNATFRQKFLFAPQHWKGAEQMAPIFLYCGNEGNIEWFAENSGFIWDIAPDFGALLVFPEHRYYGDSMPFGSQEAAYKNAESLSYLNSEQALADFVTLISDLKKNLSAEASPVVLFGGSYGGMLAAWFRLKYPHIAIGALSSSAPILQFEDVASPYNFYDTVDADFKAVSQSCHQTIKNSWDLITDIGSTTEGLHKLSVQFNLCEDLKTSSELSNWISAAWTYVAMVNYPYPADFLQDLPAFPIREMCKAMDSLPEGSDDLSRIAAATNLYYNYNGKLKCFDIKDDPHGLNGWDWQCCTEMVMPLSIRNSSMFPAYEWTLKDSEDWCLYTYGVKPRSHWIVLEFGGKDIQAVLKRFGSNIVFSNGLVDPWSGGGVLTSISSTVVALTTSEGAHHLDLRAEGPDDPQWLKDQRSTEIAHIQRWLGEFYSDRYGQKVELR